MCNSVTTYEASRVVVISLLLFFCEETEDNVSHEHTLVSQNVVAFISKRDLIQQTLQPCAHGRVLTRTKAVPPMDLEDAKKLLLRSSLRETGQSGCLVIDRKLKVPIILDGASMPFVSCATLVAEKQYLSVNRVAVAESP